jgi:hypothetical protein
MGEPHYPGDKSLDQETDVTAYCSDMGNKFSVLIHLSPEPEGQMNNHYEGVINILFADINDHEKHLDNCDFYQIKHASFSTKIINL